MKNPLFFIRRSLSSFSNLGPKAPVRAWGLKAYASTVKALNDNRVTQRKDAWPKARWRRKSMAQVAHRWHGGLWLLAGVYWRFRPMGWMRQLCACF
ncbi:MAG: hypothetical protein Q4A28_06665 [Brachymonas sp.]|nr:hypothetical protein [Brachymonas sp.]